MTLLDTHIWVWWVHGSDDLPESCRRYVEARAGDGLAVSAISCWEVAKLTAKGRLPLPLPVCEWLTQALAPSGVVVLPLTPEVAAESAHLPGTFHKDPADQIIVATARVHAVPLVTVDELIRAYPHVNLGPPH